MRVDVLDVGEAVESKEWDRKTFPALLAHERIGCIVLALGPSRGVCLKSGLSTMKEMDYADTWTFPERRGWVLIGLERAAVLMNEVVE